METAQLYPHPATPCPHSLDLIARFERPSPDRIRLRYELSGSLSQLLIPAQDPIPERLDGLWQHLCFEAFLKPSSKQGYWEFNISPSGDWAIYRFDGYRDNMTSPQINTAPTLQINHNQSGTGAVLNLTLEIELTQLDDALSQSDLQLSLTSVIETQGGDLSYWAHHHPAEKPDFHHPDGFVLHLPPSLTEKSP